MDKIGIVILNWNSAEDTIECIESIINQIKLEYIDIVIVDNNSYEKDLKKLRQYILKKKGTIINEINYLTFKEDFNILLINNHGNYGFAGGCNIALKLLYNLNYTYYWLLNNDAIVDKNTLKELLNTIKEDDTIGFVGSNIRYYDNIKKLECYGGGHHYPLLGTSKLYLKNKNFDKITQCSKSVNLDYLMGASLLLTKKLIDDIGFMNSEYFLYFEEHDWQSRAELKGWKIIVSPKSSIYHKSSKSTKNNREKYFYYISRASMMYNKRFYNSFVLYISALSLSILLIYKTKLNVKYYFSGIKGIYDGLKFNWIGDKD